MNIYFIQNFSKIHKYHKSGIFSEHPMNFFTLFSPSLFASPAIGAADPAATTSIGLIWLQHGNIDVDLLQKLFLLGHSGLIHDDLVAQVGLLHLLHICHGVVSHHLD